jgi:hypothetical protein
MSEAALDAEWQRVLRDALDVTLNDAAAAAAAKVVARGVAQAAPASPGALFDTEPSHHDRALKAGAIR